MAFPAPAKRVVSFRFISWRGSGARLSPVLVLCGLTRSARDACYCRGAPNVFLEELHTSPQTYRWEVMETQADKRCHVLAVQRIQLRVSAFDGAAKIRDPLRNCCDTRPTAIKKKRQIHHPSLVKESAQKKDATIHQRTQVDDGYEHPAARVHNDSYTILVQHVPAWFSTVARQFLC